MAEELQQLLNRINKDYLNEAEAEKNAIIKEAQARAAEIKAAAEAEAQALRNEAEAAAASFLSRAEATAQQAARDAALEFRAELERRMEQIAGQAAADALTPEFMAQIIAGLAKDMQNTDDSVTVLAASRDAEALSKALRGSLAASFRTEPRIFPKSSIRSGMQVSFNGSDVYYDFTDSAVREILKPYFGAELGKLLDGNDN